MLFAPRLNIFRQIVSCSIRTIAVGPHIITGVTRSRVVRRFSVKNCM
jgi:hypothetical protein